MLNPRQLIAARALAGWSQADLAVAARVGLSTIQGLEGGVRDTKFSSVAAIVEALRRHGVELAQSSERFIGGVLVVRGSPSDWLQGERLDDHDKQSASVAEDEVEDVSRESFESMPLEQIPDSRSSFGAADPDGDNKRRRSRRK